MKVAIRPGIEPGTEGLEGPGGFQLADHGRDMAKKKMKLKELDRRVAGISLGQAGGKAPARCHLIYEVWWSDGSKTWEKGSTLFGEAFQIDPSGKVPKNNRPDLYSKVQAAAILVNDLEYACVENDGHAKKLYR